MSEKDFYITTTLPYVNAAPHVGFALEIVQADAIARYRRSLGFNVFFNTGTDEHGQKVYRKATEEGKDIQHYVDEYAARFERLRKNLDVSYDNFIRTTDAHHMKAAQEFWKRCDKNGDIYKKNYQIKYCVGCELEKMESELVDGKCPIHPGAELELIEEENYFFKFSKYQQPLLDLYGKHPDFVVPAHRLTEIRNFVAAGLQDFSISRLKAKMPWGVPVPGDENHVMYVWFDALVNYVSALGWPEDEKKFGEFWGTKEDPKALQVAGKDNLRQQSAMWQAMLMSAGLPASRQILIHGFINSNGQKMSKSLGNVIDPFAVVEKYGTDALRFWLLHDMTPFEDGDFTWEKFNESYNAHLANGLGNFAARVLTLGEKLNGKVMDEEKDVDKTISERIEFTEKALDVAMHNFQFNEALGVIWNLISLGDRYVNEKKPWENFDNKIVFTLVVLTENIAKLLEPFMPGTAKAIGYGITRQDGKLSIKKGSMLFPRIK